VSSNEFEVSVNGNKASKPETLHFYYGLLWSDPVTWGGEVPPRYDDMAVIPEG